jgi:hypothetical protein
MTRTLSRIGGAHLQRDEPHGGYWDIETVVYKLHCHKWSAARFTTSGAVAEYYESLERPTTFSLVDGHVGAGSRPHHRLRHFVNSAIGSREKLKTTFLSGRKVFPGSPAIVFFVS